MELQAYTLFPWGQDPNLIVLATSPQEAAGLLKAEFRGPVQYYDEDEMVWEVAFPRALFREPPPGSEHAEQNDGFWSSFISGMHGRVKELQINPDYAEAIFYLREYVVVSAAALEAPSRP